MIIKWKKGFKTVKYLKTRNLIPEMTSNIYIREFLKQNSLWTKPVHMLVENKLIYHALRATHYNE